MFRVNHLMHLIAGLPLVFAYIHIPAQAQDDEDEKDSAEEIIVTGTRIRHDEYSSPSPIQVFDVETSRQLGITSIDEMLQRATVSNGKQIDASFTNSFSNVAADAPPSGGVGSSSVNLRGLGPERTLVLINGRRLGSNGVRGAPAQPDINMIPFAMVERVEVLTEGVSAVYGADAVAGVVNIILRDEFEGFEMTATTKVPSDPGGDITSFSMIAGAAGEHASAQFSAEYFNRQRISAGQRDYSQCVVNIAVTQAGEILSNCFNTLADNLIFAAGIVDAITGAAADDVWILFSRGVTNLNRPNFGTWTAQPGIVDPSTIDPSFGNFGSQTNRAFLDFYSDNDERRRSDLIFENERFSLVSTGKVNLDFWANDEVYYEAYYLNSQIFSIGPIEQIFPDIVAMIPQEDANGNIIVDATGAPVLVANPLNPLGVNTVPILTLESLPQTRDVEREQARFVLGTRGDFGDTSWIYDGFVSYDRGIGSQTQPILFENNLILATQTLRMNAAGQLVCGVTNPTGGIFGFDTPEACVPLDIFGVNSDFGPLDGGAFGDGVLTDAEIAFLIGNRTNRTVVEQTMVSGYATGDLFAIGDRTIAAAIGAEYRKDEIASQNDLIGVKGLNAAEIPLQEGETIGSRDITEVFGEISVPLLDSLSFDAAVRFTDEENFGSETTWRARIAWAPADYFSLSGSAGTSFRAPNLREQFLADQGGAIGGSNDPCQNQNIIDPTSAQTQLLISRCIDSGIVFTDSDGDGLPDTTILGTLGTTTIPISTGGNSNLKAETSDSYSATVKFNQVWTDAFDLDIALSYWSVDIDDTVSEPNAAFIISQCFTNPDLPDFNNNGFCRLLSRPGTGLPFDILNFVDVSFINIGNQTAKGIDLNTRLLYSFDTLGVDISWVTATTRQTEQEIEIFGPEDRDDNLGEIGFPKFKFNSTLSLRKNNWDLMIHNRFIGKGQQDVTQADAPDLRFAEGVAGVLSHPVNSVDSVWYTDLSLTYLGDAWSVTVGATNLFDKNPPLIDARRGNGPNRNGAVTTAGYDFFGRTAFVTVELAL